MFNQDQELFPSAGLTTLDLQAGIETSDKRWGVDVVAKNVTNAISQDFASPSVGPRFGAFDGATGRPERAANDHDLAHFKY